MKHLDLTLCLAQLSWRREGLADGLAVHLPREAIVRAMSGLSRLMTVTARFSTASTDGGDRATPKISQTENLGQNVRALLFQRSQSFSQRAPPYPNVYLR